MPDHIKAIIWTAIFFALALAISCTAIAKASDYTMYEEEQTVMAPIEFTTYCQTDDCIDRTYDIYVDTGREPVTDWELSEIHRNEWNAYYGPDWVENGQPIDPLFEGSYNPRPHQAYCEYGLGCQFKE